MSTLTEELESAQIANYCNNYFIPETSFEALLTDERIRQHFNQTPPLRNLEENQKQTCLDAILNGGRRTFAILVLISGEPLMLGFRERDLMREGWTIDSGLPFSEEHLLRIFPQELEHAARRFQRRQWELLVPVFRKDPLHRTFPQSIILPFQFEGEVEEGGFGIVYRTELFSSHQAIEAQPRKNTVRICRKTIKASTLDENTKSNSSRKPNPAFTSEIRILNLLSSLKHPNIISLLASYTIEQLDEQKNVSFIHNMLFPWADDGSLASLLNGESGRLKQLFSAIDKLVEQLYGLASAIKSLHDYVSPQYRDLRLIGLHNDLKPGNILVHEGKLLLADFGLSRLRPDTSSSRFQNGQGDYLAPECETIEDGKIKTGATRRASDIWAFGCIMLDLLIYLDGGYRSLCDFRESRRQQVIPGLWARPFHAFSMTEPLEAVTDALDSVGSSYRTIQLPLIDLIRDMLEVDFSYRTKASWVTHRLFLLSQRMVFEKIDETLEKLEGKLDSLHWEIERERLRLWRESTDLLNTSQIRLADSYRVQSWLAKDEQKFDSIASTLRKIQAELQLLAKEKDLGIEKYTLDATLFRIRQLNDFLWAMPQREELAKLTSSLEECMTEFKDQGQLQQIKSAFRTNPARRNISSLAAMRYMLSRIGDTHDTSDYAMRTDKVIRAVEKTPHFFGKAETGENVLIEYVSYNLEYCHKGHEEEEEIFQRIDKLALLLGSQAVVDSIPHVLKCSEYFHDRGILSFGLVFKFPEKAPNTPWTLKALIKAFPQRPILGDLLDLGRKMAKTVLALHKVGNWVHKNISAHNILFFLDQQVQSKKIDHMAPPIVHAPREPLPEATQKKKSAGRGWRLSFLKKSRSQINLNSPSSSSTHLPVNLPERSASAGPDGKPRSPAPPFRPCSPVPPAPTLPPPLPREALEKPYLVGFNHSREDNDTVYTTGASRDIGQRLYHHPEYMNKPERHRFQVNYDYYSLGLVLLEIGLWQTLEEFSDEEGKVAVESDAEKRKLRLLSEFVPRLGSTMGTIYRDVVSVCLNGTVPLDADDADAEGSDGQVLSWMLFEHHVVLPLGECHV